MATNLKAKSSAGQGGGNAPPAENATDWVEIDCNFNNYAGCIATLRTNLIANRTHNKACWVKVKPTGTGKCLFLCLDRKNLYVNSVRGANNTWYNFSDADGAVPTGAKVGQKGHYSQLRSENATVLNINKVLAALESYDGTDVGPGIKTNLWLIVTLVSESARFTSVCAAMTSYLTSHRVNLGNLNATVNAWETSTKAGNADVAVRWQA